MENEEEELKEERRRQEEREQEEAKEVAEAKEDSATATQQQIQQEQETVPSTRENTTPKSQHQQRDTSSPVKSLTTSASVGGDLFKKKVVDLAERERILNECKTQIKMLTVANKNLEKKLQETTEELTAAMAHKVPSKVRNSGILSKAFHIS